MTFCDKVANFNKQLKNCNLEKVILFLELIVQHSLNAPWNLPIFLPSSLFVIEAED